MSTAKETLLSSRCTYAQVHNNLHLMLYKRVNVTKITAHKTNYFLKFIKYGFSAKNCHFEKSKT
jgi:hypothetical protein